MSKRHEIRIGNLVFNIETRDLRNEAGQHIELRNKSSEVLVLLAKHRGDIVSKTHLMDVVWPDVTVTEESLTQCIADIRKAIGDRNQALLQTHIGKGYSLNAQRVSVGSKRLLAPITVFAAMSVVLVFVIAWFLTPTHAPDWHPRIAVLAFDDLSAGGDKGYLSDGVAEGIITELARYKDLRVIARNSSFKFRASTTGISEVARELRADFVVEGSKQKSGHNLRVTVQLINGQDGTHIWAESYDADIGELFDVQSKIVRSITHQIGYEVLRFPIPAGGRERVSALHHYLQGMEAFRLGGAENTQAAKGKFERAIAVDPEAPYGYVGMSWVYWRDSFSNILNSGLPREERVRRAAEFAERAMELDPAYHLAHVTRADAHVAAGELEQAVERYRAAEKLNPNDALVLAAMSDPLVFMGEAEEAILLLEKAIDLAPITPAWYYWQLGWAQWSIGRCEDGLNSMRKMSTTKPFARRVIAALHFCNGDTASARREIAKFMEAVPDHSVSEDIANFRESWRNPETMERWAEAMRAAGMPEE